MPRLDHMVFALPSRHYLEYGSCVMREIIEQNRKPNFVIRRLDGSDANPSNIDSAISEVDPIFFFGVGHGNVDIWTCECMTPYMTSCSDRARRMAGRVVHLNSCLTGRGLGPDLINKGALAYFGSRSEFWLYIGSPPCSDRAAKAVFLCEYQVEVSLLQGKTTGEAQEDRLRRYDEEIKYWTEGEGRNHPHASLIVRLLEIDKSIAVMYGRKDVRIVSVPTIPMPPVAQLLLGLMPIGVVGAVIGGEELRKAGVV